MLIGGIQARTQADGHKISGRNGDRSMTKGVHSGMVEGGFAVFASVRACVQPRPSRSSSRALLLLLSCP
jgi:hypothetical protein